MSVSQRVEKLESALQEREQIELADLSTLSDEDLRRIAELEASREREPGQPTYCFDDLTDGELGRLELLTRKRVLGHTLSAGEQQEAECLFGKIKEV